MLYADTEGIPLDLINNFSIDIQFYQVAVLLKVSISFDENKQKFLNPWLVCILKYCRVTRQIPGLTSLPLNLTAKKSTKISPAFGFTWRQSRQFVFWWVVQNINDIRQSKGRSRCSKDLYCSRWHIEMINEFSTKISSISRKFPPIIRKLPFRSVK